MQCQAKSKQSGAQCKKFAVPGKRVCGIHGGKTPGGLASPHFKTGRHSKYLPKNLLGKYKEAINDPDLLQLRDEIALMDTRLGEVLTQIEKGAKALNQFEEIQAEYAGLLSAMQAIPMLREKLTGESGSNRLEINTQWRGPKKLKTERLDEKQAGAKILETMANLGNLISAGIDSKEAWEEVQALVEIRRKLVESERKWFIENQQIITAEKALLLIAAIADIIKSNVSNTAERQTIIENISRLTLGESPK